MCTNVISYVIENSVTFTSFRKYRNNKSKFVLFLKYIFSDIKEKLFNAAQFRILHDQLRRVCSSFW